MTRRRLLALVVACAALPAAPARADVVLDPAGVFAVGSQPMQVAQQLAVQHWGMTPCNGQIAISWTTLAPQINATSTWTNPISSYDNPGLNGDCQIQFNASMDFDWPKFCTVVIHEYGHLTGHPHSPDPHDVMAAYYGDPSPECGAVDPIAQPAPAPAPAVQSAPSTTPARAAGVAVHKAVKRPARRAAKRPHRRHRTKHHRRAKARAAGVVVRHAV